MCMHVYIIDNRVFSSVNFISRHLGGKLGKEVQKRFGIEKLGQLTSVTRKQLEIVFGDKTG